MKHRTKFEQDSLLINLHTYYYRQGRHVEGILQEVSSSLLSFRREITGTCFRAYVHAPGKAFSLMYMAEAETPASGSLHMLNKVTDVQLPVKATNPPRSIHVLRIDTNKHITLYMVPTQDVSNTEALLKLPTLVALGGIDFNEPESLPILDEALEVLLPHFHLVATLYDANGTEYHSLRSLADAQAGSAEREKVITRLRHYFST